MPAGGYQVTTQPQLPKKQAAKKPTPKKAEPKSRTKPAYGARGGVPGNPLIPKEKPGPNFTDILRNAAAPILGPPAREAAGIYNAVRPYTPIPAAEHHVTKPVKHALQGATKPTSKALLRGAEALDTGTGTALDVFGSVPGTFTTPPRLGATETPTQRVKPIGTAALAARIEKPKPISFGTPYLSGPYQQYFAGQKNVTVDEIKQAQGFFTQRGDKTVPWPFTDAQTKQMLEKVKANGYDLKDAPHWTFDDLISKLLQKNEKSVGGYIRNVAGGFVQLAALPSGLVAGGAAAIAAAGGNVKPAEQFGQQFWDFTKASNPLSLNAWYKNTPGVLANLLPATKGVSGLAGRAFLKAGERDITLPATGETVTSHVPADILKRVAHETRKRLIENPNAKPGGIGQTLETRAEKQVLHRHQQLAELGRDATMMPVQKELADAARHTVSREGRIPLAGRHSGGDARLAQIAETTRTGMTPEELTKFRSDTAGKARAEQAAHLEEAKTYRRNAKTLAEEDPEMAFEHLQAGERAAKVAEGKAEQAKLLAEENEAHAALWEGTKPIAPDHPTAVAIEKASGYISDIKQELAPKKGGKITSGLTNEARTFGNSETMYRAFAQDLEDPALHKAAASEDPHISEPAKATLRRGQEAHEILQLREAVHDARLHATERARHEDAAGRSHAERGALGGLTETERASGREIGHIDTESDKLHAAQQRLDRIVPPKIGEAPYSPHEGVAPSEHTKIKQDLENIAAVHIDKERNARTGIRTRIGTIRHQLTDPEMRPERRARLEEEQKRLIAQLNTPSPRAIARIDREITAYLKRFGKRLTDREKRRYNTTLVVKQALVKQAGGDLQALSRRSRKLETRIVREQANSSRTLKGHADRLQAEYADKQAAFQRHYGQGAHATLLQGRPDRGGLRGFTNTAARGVLPRSLKPKVRRSEGTQVMRAAYSPDETVKGIFRDIRTYGDMLASHQLYHDLLKTNIVQSAAGREGEIVPQGWHWVSEGNLQKFTNEPTSLLSGERTTELADEATGDLKHGAWKTLEAEIGNVGRAPRTTIPDERGYLIRESALQALEEAVRRRDAGDFGIFLKLTNEYRKLLLFMLPRTFTNNMIGNIGLALLSGASMMDIVRASHILRNHPEAIPSLIRNRGLIASQFSHEVAGVGWMDMWRRANTFAEDLGQAATYISQVRKHYGREQGMAATGAGGILKGMDDISSDWYHVMKELAHGRDANVLPLMKRSKQFFGDVAKQTRVNKVLAGSVLFHRWLGHIVRLVTLTLPLNYPGRFAILLRISQIGDDYRKQHGVLPDWAQGVVRLALDKVHTPMGTQDVITGLSTTGLNPAQTYSQVADLGTDSNPLFPGQAVVSGALSPVISAPLSWAIGRDLGTLRPFKDQYGNDIRPFSGKSAAHIAWQDAPVLNTILSTANTSGDSTPFTQHPAASSPAAYRRQQAYPFLIHANSPKDAVSTILRGFGIPLTRLDSYGPRYDVHLASLAFALAKQQKDRLNSQIGKPVAPPASAPTPAASSEKALSPTQRAAQQKAYAAKLRAGKGSNSNAARKKAQRDYAKKLRNG